MEESGGFDSSFVAGDFASASSTSASGDHVWQKVVPKRPRRPFAAASSEVPPVDRRPNNANAGPNVFAAVEQKAHERRRAIESETAIAAQDVAASRSKTAALSDDEDESGGDAAEGVKENGVVQEKKTKPKKPKKPKITVADAAAKIDASDLGSFLADISVSYETQPEIQLMRFADYFGRSFTAVNASQFPWTKIFKESPVSKIIDIPISHIPAPVYKTSFDWISTKSVEVVGDFALWCLDSIIADLENHLAYPKGSKKPVPQPSSKSQVAVFTVLSIALRRKPDVLVRILPKLRENPKYQGHEKLPAIIWIIGQASQGDLVIGMYAWAHYLLPLICGKLAGNTQSRNLVLLLVERIVSAPKARTILLNGAIRKGERLIPPASFDLLIQATFPSPTERVKATERFEALYPTLKDLALAGSPGSKSTKLASEQLFHCAVKALKDDDRKDLKKEGLDLFTWCLSQNTECYKQWEKLHLENIHASLAVLNKISGEWSDYSDKLFPLDSLQETVEHLKAKNAESLSGKSNSGNLSIVKEADKYCKVILGRLNRKPGCGKAVLFFLTLAVTAGAAFISLTPNPN